MSATEEQILDIIRKHTPDAATPITRGSRLEDTGIDSYGLIEVVFDLEEQLGTDIPYNANDKSFADAETVGDLIDKLLDLLEKA
ncbi:MAG: acyl carrier protein [Sphingomonadales bacterium]